MADYTTSKPGIGAVYPDNALESTWSRLEPLITAEGLRIGHLFGIPLVSAIRDPITKKAMVMTDDILTKYIERAASLVELETNIDIFPTQYAEKHPFDRQEYESFGYFRTIHRPVTSIEALSIVPPNNLPVYNVLLDWVETGYLHRGQINIIPLTLALTNGSTVPPQSAGGALFLSILTYKPWIAAFWQITYTAGFPDGMVPRIVNELVATVSAMEILSMLATTYAKSTSTSLGIDALSQSISTPGPNLFKPRLDELADKRQRLTKAIKTWSGQNIFSGNI